MSKRKANASKMRTVVIFGDMVDSTAGVFGVVRYWDGEGPIPDSIREPANHWAKIPMSVNSRSVISLKHGQRHGRPSLGEIMITRLSKPRRMSLKLPCYAESALEWGTKAEHTLSLTHTFVAYAPYGMKFALIDPSGATSLMGFVCQWRS